MTKQEQMEYLQVACDAEDAVFTCEKAIEALEEKIKTISPPDYPPEPKPVEYKDLPTSADLGRFQDSFTRDDYRKVEYKNQHHIIAKTVSILIGVVSFTLLFILNPPTSHILPFLAWCFLPPALACIVWALLENGHEFTPAVIICVVSCALFFILHIPFIGALLLFAVAYGISHIALEYSPFGCILWGAFLYVLPPIVNPPTSNNPLSLVLYILPVVLTITAWKVSGRIADHKKWKDYDNQVYLLYAEKRQADKDRYNKEDQQFRKQLKVYNQGCQLTRDAKDILGQELERLRTQVRALDTQRQQVYGLGVLHEQFRNSLAVHQLRAYFDMGVCDTLEGPGGAIAQYLMDLRTNRICGTIDELRTALETGVQAIITNQGHILQEVREANNRITSMGHAITSQLNFMQGNILSAQHAAQERMEACMDEATKHLDAINTTLKDAAHNEYIAMKAAKVEGYLNLHRIS